MLSHPIPLFSAVCVFWLSTCLCLLVPYAVSLVQKISKRLSCLLLRSAAMESYSGPVDLRIGCAATSCGQLHWMKSHRNHYLLPLCSERLINVQQKDNELAKLALDLKSSSESGSCQLPPTEPLLPPNLQFKLLCMKERGG